MKRFVVYSFLIHVSIVLLIAFSRGPYKKIIPKERIVPINIISMPSLQREPERKARVLKQKSSPPAEKKREAHRKPPPAVTETRKDQRELVSPDLVSKIKPMPLSKDTLKDKISDRLKALEPVPQEAPEVKHDNDTHKKEERLALDKPREKSTSNERMTSPTFTLKTENFPYAWYIAIIKNKIYENWSPPKQMTFVRPGVETMIKFRVHRTGKVSNVAIEKTSGYTLLDRSAHEAVGGVTNLPPLPTDYREEYLNVVVFFTPVML